MKNINEKEKALERLHDDYRKEMVDKEEEEWIKLHIDENNDGA